MAASPACPRLWHSAITAAALVHHVTVARPRPLQRFSTQFTEKVSLSEQVSPRDTVKVTCAMPTVVHCSVVLAAVAAAMSPEVDVHENETSMADAVALSAIESPTATCRGPTVAVRMSGQPPPPDTTVASMTT